MRKQINLVVATTTILVLGATSLVGAEIEAEADQNFARTTISAGVGNSMGWFGVQGEKYFQSGRLSGFVGMGVTPHGEDSDGMERSSPEGVTLAVGGRVFTAGIRHRFFAEVSITQVSWESIPRSIDEIEAKRRYGPGLQLGYQRIADSGFTFLASSGVGYALGAESGRTTGLILALGLGHTWR